MPHRHTHKDIRFTSALKDSVLLVFRAIYLNPIKMLLFIAGVIFITAVAVTIHFFLNEKRAFLAQITAESFGMVLDIIVLGVLMIWINRVNDRKRKIEAAVQEIDDLRIWGAEMLNSVNPVNGQNTKMISSAEEALNKWKISYSALKIARHIKTLNSEGIFQVDLNHCQLPSSNLSHKKLNGSNLDMCDLSASRMDYISLKDCSACGASFQFSDLRQANLLGIKANGASFEGALLSGVIMDHGRYVNTSFVGAKLTDVSFNESDLTAADFSKATLVNVDFSKATGLTARQLVKARMLNRCNIPPHIEVALKNLKTKGDSVSFDQPAPPYNIQKLAG